MDDVDTQKISSPFAVVIFGATGDLTQRKLIPALTHLFVKKLLPKNFYIVGFSRRKYSQADFSQFLHTALTKYHSKSIDPILWKAFSQNIYYQQGDFDEEAGYNQLIEVLKKFDDEQQACVPRFFYLATPPDKYASILNYLHRTKLSEGCGQGSDKWTKIMIEKPFGKSVTDARGLDSKLSQFFKEKQIYRIDHYLGKETVQNMLAFRFGNEIFKPIWNKKYIDHVQVTIAENLGVETRGNFFEGVGTLRDMAQSHLLELMAAVTMDEPKTFDAQGIRDARTKSIEQIKLIEPNQVSQLTVRGQYGPNPQLEFKGYRQEENVQPTSNTETFVALKLESLDTHWEGVPFYMRTGKRLAKKATEISVVFKPATLKMLGGTGSTANVLTFRIEPNEGIELTLNAKRVGFGTAFESVPMSFEYQKDRMLPEAYERLLLDAMRGEQTLFTRTDEVAASWELITKISDGWWNQGTPPFPNYEAGSWGPKEAQQLIEKDGREWLLS